MREDRLAPVQGKRAGDGASSACTGLGSRGGFPESACCGCLRARARPAVLPSPFPSPLPLLFLCRDQGQRDLEFPEKDPQSWPRSQPATPLTEPVVPWDRPSTLSEYLRCVVWDFMGVQGLGRGQEGRGGPRAPGAPTGSSRARRGVPFICPHPRAPGEDSEAQRKRVTCPSYTVR